MGANDRLRMIGKVEASSHIGEGREPESEREGGREGEGGRFM